MTLDRTCYRFGGYLITQAITRPAGMSPDLLPEHIITATGCLASFIPDVWMIGWTSVNRAQREAKAATLGIDPATLTEIIRDVTTAFAAGDLGWPNVIKTAQAAGLRARRRSALVVMQQPRARMLAVARNPARAVRLDHQ